VGESLAIRDASEIIFSRLKALFQKRRDIIPNGIHWFPRAVHLLSSVTRMDDDARISDVRAI
jgi:hypothetical protein